MSGLLVHIHLFGPLRVTAGDDPVALAGRKVQGLLVYLCCRAGTPVPRETLCGLLWGERTDDQARASLRQALATLRKALGPAAAEAINASADTINVVADQVLIDIARFDALARSDAIADLSEARALYQGELFEGAGSIEPEFDRWLSGERAAMRARHGALLDRLSGLFVAAGQADEAIACDTQLLALDPLQENVHRRLMRAYAGQHRYDTALRQFAEAQAILAADLGLQPEPSTMALAQEIRARRRSPQDLSPVAQPTAPLAATPVLPDRPSVAVLPFRALSGDVEAAYFGEGVSEDLTIELSRVADLMVVARQSTLRFGPDGADPREVGRALGVRFCLGGSVRMIGSRVRISAHLARCEDGRQVWAESYDRMIADIFDIQTEIARTVAGTVVGRIAAVDFERIRSDRPENLSSYDLVLKGLSLMNAYDFDAALGCFETANAADPAYARPLGLMALSRVYRRWYFEVDPDMSEAIPFGERAIALDPGEARAHCALAIARMLRMDHHLAAYHFSVAMDRNRNDDLLLSEYARYLMYVDRAEDGIRHIREAMRLNPFHPQHYWNIYGRCLHTLGRHAEALEMFQRIDMPTFWVHSYMAACHAMLGDPGNAATHRDKIRGLYPAFDFDRYVTIFPYSNPATKARFVASLSRAGLDRH